ncbi:amino acid ABC transporter permease [Variovorax boronicumulans]|uniref:amino acid ABC transporter permease n=1 Tax=Variovorax boronicumulans TaxID=436515 RepID=UPI001C58C3F5
MTIGASLLVIVASTALGLVFAAARSSPRAGLRRATAVYVSLFRNTPLLVQLFFWYFGAPSLLPDAAREWLNAGHHVSVAGLRLHWPSFEFLTAIVGLVLYATAYVGEEIRAGIRGVPAAQLHAGMAMGFSAAQVQRHVVLPQAVRIALAPLFGQYMNIVKNTSLAMAVGLVELSYTSRQVEADTFKTFQAFGFATLFYIATIALLEWLSARAVKWSVPGARAVAPRGAPDRAKPALTAARGTEAVK